MPDEACFTLGSTANTALQPLFESGRNARQKMRASSSHSTWNLLSIRVEPKTMGSTGSLQVAQRPGEEVLSQAWSLPQTRACAQCKLPRQPTQVEEASRIVCRGFLTIVGLCRFGAIGIGSFAPCASGADSTSPGPARLQATSCRISLRLTARASSTLEPIGNGMRSCSVTKFRKRRLR